MGKKRETIGSRVKARRIALGLSQEALSEKSGIRQSHLSAVERGGNARLTVETVRKLASGLGCSVGDLID